MAEQDIDQAGQENQLNIELSEEVAEGIYCNLVMVAHTPTEFVLDFIRVMPGMPRAKVRSRVLLTPEHAVRFLGAIKENIQRYEDTFGPIREPGDQAASAGGKLPIGFGRNMGQA